MDDWVKQQLAEMPNLKYVPVISNALPEDNWTGRTGFVHKAVLEDFPDLSGYQVYACGAPIVVDSAREEYSAVASLPPDEFHADAFTTEAEKHKTEIKMHETQTFPSLGMGAAASLSPALALAQGRPIRLIVPYAPGGPIDVTARLLAERVKDSLGTVIIENKPGGGGNIGADAVAKAAPDGLTIGIAAVATHAINPWLFAKMPYDASKDFAPVTQMVRVPNVLVMNAETAGRLKINTLADLIAYGKANPGRLNYGSGGNGSAGHLAGEMFKQGAGIFAVHIPYNGGNPAQLALLWARSTSTSTISPPPRPTSAPANSRPLPSPR